MRVKTFYRMLRYISAIVLFFFLWTFGPVWQAVAFAATPQKMKIKRPGVSGKRIAETRTATSAEKFEKALDDVRQKLTSAEDKVNRGVEPTPELAAIKEKLAEIESLDTELTAEFAATKKKLIDSHLPKEILDRHHKFVKHYKDNMKELIANLTAVEQGANHRSMLEKALKKAKEHLDRVKAPSRHQKLDPNNLPFRNRKALKAKAPRLRKKDFEKDFPPQKHKTIKSALLLQRSQRSPRTAENQKANDYLSHTGTAFTDVFNSASRMMHPAPGRKPILIASNGPLIGLLSSSPKSEPALRLSVPSMANEGLQNFGSLSAMSGEQSPVLLAQATDLPTADDLAETPDIQFTDAIRAKAQELDHKPAKIYEWVRNNIEYAPTYGSIQGADQCLQSKICNDMDTASLLIALLRASGIYAHYMYGTIEIPIAKAMNWVGGVTDPKMVGTIFATNGVPVKTMISGETIKAVQIEHVWVSAFIDYIPSRGAVQIQGDTWIPLDASFKQYNYTQGINIASAVPFDAQSFANQLLSTATTNTADGSVTNVDSTYVQQTMTDYQTKVQNYIQQNYPNATVGDVIGKKEINPKEYHFLPCTLPYKAVQVGSEFSTIPDNLRETISFSIPDPTESSAGLSYTTGMPQIAGKKITLSFSPATSNDISVIESLLPPNLDGTTIDPSQLPTSLPAYLINLKPELRIDGQVVATGATTMMGSDQAFTMTLDEPGIGISNINNIEKAGEYFGIGIDTGRINNTQIAKTKTRIQILKDKLENNDYSNITKDDLVGEILYTFIQTYFALLDSSDEAKGKASDIIRYRATSIGMFSTKYTVQDLFGVQISAQSDGMMMDVDRIMQAVFGKDSSQVDVKQYMALSGNESSLLEYAVPETLLSSEISSPSISAVKALQIANDQGVPIDQINRTNIDSLLPKLEIGAGVKEDIQNAINAGKIVIVSERNISFHNWTGCGYIILDPNTNAGAYMLSNNTSGSWIILGIIAGSLAFFGILLIAAWFFVAASVCLAVIGAIMLGLGIGIALSQMDIDKAQAELALRIIIMLTAPLIPIILSPAVATAVLILFLIALIYMLLERVLSQFAENMFDGEYKVDGITREDLEA